MITGSDLREARTRAKLSQQELATRVGVSLRTVNNWENGRNVPRNSEPTIRTVLEDYLNAGESNSPRLRAASDEELLSELRRRFDELRKEGQAHGHTPAEKTTKPPLRSADTTKLGAPTDSRTAKGAPRKSGRAPRS